MSTQQGLALFDAALSRPSPNLVPAVLDTTAVSHRDGVVAVLRDLARLSPDRPTAVEGAQSSASALSDRLADATPDERREILLDLVRRGAAAVLAHPSPHAIDPGTSFKDLGFDSLTSVELRNRLNTATGMRLSAAVLFDRPTPGALAEYLRKELAADDAGPPALAELDRLEAALIGAELSDDDRAAIDARMQVIAHRLHAGQNAGQGSAGQGSAGQVKERLKDASIDEVFTFIDRELGSN